MRGMDVQEGRKLARLETISAVIYDALLVFQLCISRRGNELAAIYTCTPLWTSQIQISSLFFLSNLLLWNVSSLTGGGKEGGGSDQGKSP